MLSVFQFAPAWAAPRSYGLVLFLCLLLSSAASLVRADIPSAPVGEPDLTREEREWLRAHPRIVLGVDPDFAPYSMIDRNGQFVGMAADFVNAIGKRLGVEFIIGPQRAWPDIIAAAKRREIDVIATATRTAEREAYLAFSSTYLKTPLVIMTRDDDPLRSRDGLKDRSVALVNGYASTKAVLDDFPEIKSLLVRNPLEGLIAVATGQADAYVGAIGVNYAVANASGISNLRVAALFDIEQGQNFGVRKDWALLADILDKALAAIPELEKAEIRRRWVPSSIFEDVAGKARLGLGERSWMAGHPHIHVGLVEDDAPTEFVNFAGRPAGIVPAYLDLLSRKTGLKFEVVRVRDRAQLLAMLRDRSVDMVSVQIDGDSHKNGHLLSEPIQSAALAVFSRRSAVPVDGVADLAGKRVALTVSGTASSVLRRYDAIASVPMTTPRAVLQAVNNGEADAGVLDADSGAYLIRTGGFEDIRMTHVIAGESTPLRLAIRSDWPELVEIVNHALAATGAEETMAIRHSSLYDAARGGVPREQVVFWSAVAVSVAVVSYLLLIFRSNRRLATEVEQRRQADANARASEQRFSQTFTHAAVGMALVDLDGRWLRVNENLCAMLGYSEAELTQLSFKDITHPDDRPASLGQMERLLSGEIADYSIEKRYRRRDGDIVWGLLTVALVRDDAGQPDYFVSVVEDITQRKIDEARIEFLAYHDALTSLPNRALIADRVTLAITEARRTGNGLALLFLDLDHFKEINDTLGHNIGDELLIQVTRRLKASLRAGDSVGRLGGDEFLIIIADIAGNEPAPAVMAAIDKIFDHLEAPFYVDGAELSVTASIGIAVFPEEGSDFDTLLRKADTAMYSAKRSGRNISHFFAEKMNLDAIEYEQIRTGLRFALERHQLSLDYQPQVDLESQRVIGAEALLRWRHPDLGAVAPSRFIPIAESSGVIVSIGAWVLEEACNQAAAWQKSMGRDFSIAVNLSAVQFRRGDLVEMVSTALKRTGLSPASLELELTESILIQDVESTLEVVKALRKLGVRLSIDDFGTGYSSLSYLKRFPVNSLKIDQSFVRNMFDSPDDEAIVASIIGLAKNLRLTTIAEGIETPEQHSVLLSLGCDEGQGYLIGRPMPAAQWADWFERHQSGA